MGRTSQKYKHNAKSLRRYKVKELRNFIKENKLPIKRTSKLTKGEIISNLIKLQRNGYCECFNGLAIREKKKLTPLQEQALLKGQNAMKERRRLMKEQVKPSQKIDKKPIKVPQKIEVPVTKEIIEEISNEIKNELNKPTQLELLKNEGMPNQVFDDILNLDDLFNKAEQVSQKDVEYFEDIFGLLEKEEPQKEELQKEELQKEEEKKEEPEEINRIDISVFTIREMKMILDDIGVSIKGAKLKRDYIELIYNNREKIDNLRDLINEKKIFGHL